MKEQANTFADDGRHAGNVGRARRDGGGHGSLGVRQGDADVGGFQGTAVVGAVATHADYVAQSLKILHHLNALDITFVNFSDFFLKLSLRSQCKVRGKGYR